MSNIDHKKLIKSVKNDHNLHVALLMREGLSKPDATVAAYAEGRSGLNVRMNPELPA